MPHTKRIEVRWRDMDAFGHVNNSVYLTYLEEARDEYYTLLLGLTVERMVIRRVEVDFLQALTQDDDLVEVDVRITRVGSSSVTSTERIRRAGDATAAVEATTVMVHTDDARAVAAPLPDAARTTLEDEL